MTDQFKILDVSEWKPLGDEPMGSKRKFWLEAPDGRRWLFKQRHRDHTGDDWAEKLAAELAQILGVPHAVVELAIFRELVGIVSLDFTEKGHRGELIHGNELLVFYDPAYPMRCQRRAAQHTLGRILEALQRVGAVAPREVSGPAAKLSAAHAMVGYLMLDALIGNTDRHHENWAVLVPVGSASTDVELAPSFDHAASLGQILKDEQRTQRLQTKDRGFTVEAFVRRAMSAVFSDGDEAKLLTTHEAFRSVSMLHPDSAATWLAGLRACGNERLASLADAVPPDRISSVSRQFAQRMLVCNRAELLAQNR